jgi:antirestriction protein ArdC
VWPDIESKITEAPEFIQKWYSKYQDKLMFDKTSDSKHAYYSPSTGGITMHVKNDANNERGAYSTFFHEFGHLLDDAGSVWVDTKNKITK